MDAKDTLLEELDDLDEMDDNEEISDEYVKCGDERENAIEWYSGRKTMTLSLSQRKLINKIKKMAAENPDDISYSENADGTICAHIPVAYLSIRKPRFVSEEEREQARIRFMKLKEEGKMAGKEK